MTTRAPIPLPSARRWEHFAHDADVGIRGYGRSPAEAFEQAASALTATVTNPARIDPTETVEIACTAPDLEILLVDWLNALIYEMATRKMCFGRFEVKVHGNTLNARVHGERVDAAKHEPAVEVKGATYTELRVAQQPDGRWLAQCVVDV